MCARGAPFPKFWFEVLFGLLYSIMYKGTFASAHLTCSNQFCPHKKKVRAWCNLFEELVFHLCKQQRPRSQSSKACFFLPACFITEKKSEGMQSCELGSLKVKIKAFVYTCTVYTGSHQNKSLKDPPFSRSPTTMFGLRTRAQYPRTSTVGKKDLKKDCCSHL